MHRFNMHLSVIGVLVVSMLATFFPHPVSAQDVDPESVFAVSMDTAVDSSLTPNSYIFRIKAGECGYKPIDRRLTGFRVKGVRGIVTALHGVVDCKQINAEPARVDEQVFNDLKIQKVDIQHDLALLSSAELDAVAADGFAPIEYREEIVPLVTDSTEFYVVGYPLGLAYQNPTEHIISNGIRILNELIPDNFRMDVINRDSPSPQIEVVQVQAHVVPGHSGAPLLTYDNSLVGIVDGGLEEGGVEIGWVIPWFSHEWVSFTAPEVQQKLTTLKTEQDPSLAFAFSKTFMRPQVTGTPFHFSAYVKDRVTLLGIERVEITISRSDGYDVAFSDPQGFFSLQWPTQGFSGLVDVLLEAPGYEREIQTKVNLKAQALPALYVMNPNPVSSLHIVLEQPGNQGIYLVSGTEADEFEIGDDLVVYKELLSGVDMPIALLRVVDHVVHGGQGAIVAQALLITEYNHILPGMRVDGQVEEVSKGAFVPYLKSADGFFLRTGLVRIRPQLQITRARTVVAYDLEIEAGGKVDMYPSQTEMCVTQVGSEGQTARVRLIKGEWPEVGTFVKLMDTPCVAEQTSDVPVTSDDTSCMLLAADLQFGQISKWGSFGYIPASIDLADSPVLRQLVEPTYQGSEQLYGLLTLGLNNLYSVILDQDDAGAKALYVDLNQNLVISPDERISVYESNGNGSTNPVEFRVQYASGAQPYSLYFYYNRNFNQEIGAFRLAYVHNSLRVGCMQAADRDYTVAVIDENVNGLFNDLDSDVLAIDENNDGQFEDTELIDPMTAPIAVSGWCYEVLDVSPSGDALALQESSAPARWDGTVRDATTNQEIPNVLVEVFSSRQKKVASVSDNLGQYALLLCPGYHNNIRASHPDYLTTDLSQNYYVAAGQTTTFDILLTPRPQGPVRGQVRLQVGDSYYFLGREKGQYSGGELYLGFSDGKLQFWANNLPQRGVTSLGNLGDQDLSTVEIPTSGYTRFGVEVRTGDTYVALARSGEEGRYVVFRVVEIEAATSVLLDYVYR